MRSSKRGNIDHEQQIVQLTTDEVIDRYKLRAASQIGWQSLVIWVVCGVGKGGETVI
jgi:hypothetical protein